MSSLSRDVRSGQSSDLILSSLNGSASATLLAALIEEEPKTLEAKIEILTQLKQCCEALECDLENKTTFLHWTAIASGFATAAVLCGTAALNPLAGFLIAATSATSAVATVGGSLLHNKEAVKTIEKLKRLQLVLKSDEAINWACLWGLGGFTLFCEALAEASKGNLTDFEIIRKGKLNALTVAAKHVAQSKGIQLDVLVTQLTEIKAGKRQQLKEDIIQATKAALQESAIQSSVKTLKSIIDTTAAEPVVELVDKPASIPTPPVPPTSSDLDVERMNQNAWDILQALVIDADKSKLPGCVILAAPGAGKTTYLGTAWGRLKEAYGSRFNSLAIIVKHDDLEAFQGVSDNCLVVEDNPREAAIAILRFIKSCDRKDNKIRRLFLDDFLTMNEVFKAALSGLLINPMTFKIAFTRKEDYDAQPFLLTLNTALNKLWLVGRQNNAGLWVSSHSSNVEALPFVTSREARDVGSTIFLAHSSKRYFIEQALNNPNLIPDNTKRQLLKASLELIETDIEEPLVLGNFNNWTLGIVSSEVHDEYQEFRKEWEAVEPVLKPGEKMSDVIKNLEASLEASNETDEEGAIDDEVKEEVKEVEMESSDININDLHPLIKWLRTGRQKQWVKFKGKEDRDMTFVNWLSDLGITAEKRDVLFAELVKAEKIEISPDGYYIRLLK